jgi:membrane-bound serine protease (ClpP class)
MKPGIFIAILFLLLTSVTGNSQGSKPEKKILVYKFDITENIMPSVWRKTKLAFAEADSLKADIILIHMNTYGGTVVDADSIRTKILHSKTPVYVFIDNNAASAGALIAIACDRIYMRSGGSIGAATVVNQTGQKMPDKYQSYMRSTMRATAEAHGKDTIVSGQDTTIRWKRDPLIAEAMVDERVYIPGVIDTGKVLTFTPDEAIRNHYCEGIAESIPEVLRQAGVENYDMQEFKPTVLDNIIGFLINPIVSGILIMAILGGIYFELQTPGIGFPLGVAVLAAILYFAPLYLEGLAENWEIVVFIIGLVLLGIELFVIPGFGVTGILGITFIVGGLVLALINNVKFNFEHVDGIQILKAFAIVLSSMFLGFLLSLYLSQKLLLAQKGPLHNLSLHDVQEKEKGFVGIDPSLLQLKGKTGIAQTMLRPAGKVLIDGKIYDAVAETGLIEKGSPVTVVRIEAAQIYVEKI